MVIGKIGSFLALGLVGAFLLNTLIRPASASATGGALQETGLGIASIGSGIGDSLQSIGEGASKLFNPLFTLRDLVWSPGVAGSANMSPVAQKQGDTANRINTGSNTVTWSSRNTTSTPGGGANISSLGSQRASGGGFRAAN